ncbi:MAG: hypothetical protein ACOY41_08005 [Pseudomonadota bacterium]
MKKTFLVFPLALSLAGCPLDSFVAPQSAGPAAASAAPAQPLNVATFLSRLESARGTALSAAEKTAVGGAVQGTRSLLDGGQQIFLSKVSQLSGLDAATLGVIFPPATRPVSQADVVAQLESKVGRKLDGGQAQAARAATALRNSSLDSLKGSLAARVAKTVGMEAAFVESLLPLLGF